MCNATLLSPHGEKLINRMCNEEEKRRFLEEIPHMKTIEVSERTLADIECISTGVYSPLEGFMTKEDYENVVKRMHLTNGVLWPIPVTLPVSKIFTDLLSRGESVLLTYQNKPIAVLSVEDIYSYDKIEEAKEVYGTVEQKHPGVALILSQEDRYIGGKIKVLAPLQHNDFLSLRLTPEQTRKLFKERGWKTVVAFQTRNPLHRAHEYIQKIALETHDGLFLNPLVGTTKEDDVDATTRIKTYQVILDQYYPKERFVFSVFPASMRYAGPREAIMHAIARQNYGCSHMIIGRDHAGVGSYYGTYDAQKIFDRLLPGELKIQPLKFEHAFFCSKCEAMATTKTCPHDESYRIHLSGTQVRKMLEKGQHPPATFSRPEVADILIRAYKEKNR